MLTPLGTRVVVKPVDQEKKRASGIIMADVSKGAPTQGIILSTGDECKFGLKFKDTVLYAKYSGAQLEHNEEQLLVMEENEILAKVE